MPHRIALTRWLFSAAMMASYIGLVLLPSAVGPETVPPTPAPRAPSPFPPFSEYVKKGVALPERVLPRVPEACHRFWRALAALDLRPFMRDFAGDGHAGTVVALDVIDPDGLVKAVSGVIGRNECRRLPEDPSLEAIEEHGRDLLIQCRTAADLVRASGSGPAFEGCVRELLWLRFYTVDWLTRDRDLARMDEPELLVHRLLARGSRMDVSRAPEVAAIAERILQLTPESTDAARAALQFRYVEFRAHPADSGAAARFESALARAEVLEGDPPSAFLRELRLNQARLRNDKPLLQRLATRERDRFPESALGVFYLAWGAYLEHDLERSAALVRESESREPTSLQAYSASKKLQDGEFRGPDLAIFQEDAGDFGFAVRLHTRGRPVEFRGGYALIPSLNQDLSAMVRALDTRVPRGR